MRDNGIKPIPRKKTGIDKAEAIIWYICVFFIVLGGIFHCTKHLYLDNPFIPEVFRQLYFQSESLDWAQTVMAIVTLSMFFLAISFSKNMEKKVPAYIRILVIAFALIAMIEAIFNSAWDIFANSFGKDKLLFLMDLVFAKNVNIEAVENLKDFIERDKIINNNITLPFTGKDIMSRFNLKSGLKIGELINLVKDKLFENPDLSEEDMWNLIEQAL